MTIDNYLELMQRAIREASSYSSTLGGWVVPSVIFQLIYLEHLEELPPQFTCAEEVLEEGARRGLWEMDLDREMETDVVLMK